MKGPLWVGAYRFVLVIDANHATKNYLEEDPPRRPPHEQISQKNGGQYRGMHDKTINAVVGLPVWDGGLDLVKELIDPGLVPGGGSDRDGRAHGDHPAIDRKSFPSALQFWKKEAVEILGHPNVRVGQHDVKVVVVVIVAFAFALGHGSGRVQEIL